MTSSSDPLATLDHYLRVSFGDLKDPDMALAADLAAENVHHALQADLAGVGPVEVITEPETADKACAYRVSGPNDSYVDVEVSTVGTAPGSVDSLPVRPRPRWKDQHRAQAVSRGVPS